MDQRHSVTTHLLALFPLSELDRSNRLLVDYLLNTPSATELFAHDPEEMVELAGRIRAQADRTALSKTLVTFQKKMGADAAGVAAARLLVDPATPVVTAGQQSGLLTGPLYTIYKAMTVINVAHRLAERIGRPVVPVFWVGADDDDRGEADHCGCWDQQYAIHQLHYPELAGSSGQIIGNLPAGNFAEQVLEQVESLISGLPFAGETMQMLRETQLASENMGEWFCRLMARLFSAQGMVICDPRLPEIRQLSAEVLYREIAAPLRTTDLVNERAHELQRRGYRPQLTKPADTCNFFKLNETRQRVTYRDGLFHVEGQAYSKDDLHELITQQPEQWMPNAVLRPVVQEYLLGSTLFVSGPNELGYWAELHPVFQALGVEMPPVMPRGAMTLAPAGIARLIQHWQLSPLELLYDYDQVRYNLLAAQQPESVERGFTRARAETERLLADLSQSISRVDSTLAQSVLAANQRMLNELERLERKTLKAIERQSTEQTARLERVRKTLFPWRGLQERTLNIFCLLARYGPDLLTHLTDLLDGEEGRHLFVEL